MKLKKFEHLESYCFKLELVTGEIKTADLTDLIAKHVGVEDLSSACIDPEWGCLQFKNGNADIEPKTLYKFATSNSFERAA
ncbi:MAG: DUF2442 domain-containing protein [Gammaproteobacteria bacterium]|nr:DUF2442 domain-containing protein [Gammaproteobacteria bacterium]